MKTNQFSQITSVDYFSLDVEGNELQILETIPFDKVNIRVSFFSTLTLTKNVEHNWAGALV